ncbi:MAG: hypothetical protein EBE86_002545 [Hormoscilla sp. GUM202]|nr:hypothetical protein [Hormoscilla sp. GUM202]
MSVILYQQTAPPCEGACPLSNHPEHHHEQTASTFFVKKGKSAKWAAIAAAGVAAVAGLGAVGITSLRRQDPTDILEVPEADAETASEYVVETVLTEVTVKEETPATETSDRELALVK